MAHWREDYLAALTVRDQREKANATLYDACPSIPYVMLFIGSITTDIILPNLDTQLADRTSKLATPASNTSPVPTQSQAQPSIPSPLVASSKKQQSVEIGPTPTDLLNITRADLSGAQRSRFELQDRLNRVNIEVEKLRKLSTQDGRRIKLLESERAQLKLRLNDRDAELKGKAKLLEVGCYESTWTVQLQWGGQVTLANAGCFYLCRISKTKWRR